MVKRAFVRSLPLFFAVWMFLLHTFALPHNAFRFIDGTEIVLSILMIPLCAFILYEKTEIELALVSGMGTSRLFFTKLVPLITYTVIPTVAFAFIFKSDTMDELSPGLVTMEKIPEYVPDNYRILTAVSVAVTVLFFFSLYALVRVVTRSSYLPILICFGLAVGIRSFSASIQAMRLPLTYSLFDPFISTYFIGNTVPDTYAEKFPELAVMANAWTYNRVLFAALSLLILFVTHLILRREKLHRGFGE